MSSRSILICTPARRAAAEAWARADSTSVLGSAMPGSVVVLTSRILAVRAVAVSVQSDESWRRRSSAATRPGHAVREHVPYEPLEQVGARRQRAHEHMLVIRVCSATDRTEPVERGDPERGGEVAVRSAADVRFARVAQPE